MGSDDELFIARPQHQAVDRAIAAVAAKQHGNIHRKQLLGLGLDSNAIGYRVRAGRLHRVHMRVYGVGRPPLTALERAAAAVLACGPRAALSHASAMTLWGMGKRWRFPLHVTVPGDRRPAGIHVHRSTTLTQRDLRKHLGIRVTSPARTLFDCAPKLSDKALARAVNEARLSGHLRLADLGQLIERFPGHPSATRLASFIENPSGPTRSEFEDSFLAFCERFRLPRPQTNVKLAGYLVDALFEAEKLIVELDGYGFHSDRGSFEGDRERDAQTLAHGYGTVRITWDRLIGAPGKEASRLESILRSRRSRAA